MPSVCLYNVECKQSIGLRSDFTLLVVISILFCSPKMYGSQSGSRLFILREPFSVYGSFGSRVFVFTAYDMSHIKVRVHTTSSLQKVIIFYDYFSKKKYDFFMTSAIFLCRGLMFSNDVTH